MRTYKNYQKNHPHLKMPILEILATHEEIKLLFEILKKNDVNVSETELDLAFKKSYKFISINNSRFYFSIHPSIQKNLFVITFYEYDEEIHHKILRKAIDYAKKKNLMIVTNKLDRSLFSLKNSNDL